MILACQPGTNINEGCWRADQTRAGTKTCPYTFTKVEKIECENVGMTVRRMLWAVLVGVSGNQSEPWIIIICHLFFAI